MLSDSKLQMVIGLVEGDSWNLEGVRSRRRLGKLIAERTGMWEGRVQEFLEEMVGLDLRHVEDRETFYLFCRAGL